MKRALAAIAATGAALYGVFTYDGAPLAVASDTNGSDTTSPALDATQSGDNDADALATEDDRPATTTSTSVASRTTAAPSATTTSTSTTSTTAKAAKKTVKGSPEDTGYGAITVSITVEGNKITAVTGNQASTSGTSRTIVAGAMPKLQTAAIKAQSAKVDTVSGATYTSEGFKKSLASAIQNAGLPA